MVTHYTQRKRPERKGETNSGELKLETAGYIPAQAQIMNIIDAGKRLVNYRKENYDFQPGEPIDDSLYLPERTPNFDMADASRIAEETEARLRAQKAVADTAKTLEAQEKADKIKQNALDAELYKKSLTDTTLET